MASGVRSLSVGISMLIWLGVATVLVDHVASQAADDNKIIVTSILGKPYLSMKNTTEPMTGNDRFEGFVKDLLDLLVSRVNVEYELQIQTTFGSMSNGTWNGMIGDLIERRADMALASLTESMMRARVVDFGKHFQTFGRVAIVKKWPTDDVTIKSIHLEVRLGRLFAPLDDSVWLLSGLAWFVASLVLYIICRINPYEWRQMHKDREATLREGESFSCVNTYWFMLSAIFWQGFMRAPRSMGARIVVTFWWLYALIFVSMYIASLTNYLQSVPQLNQIVREKYTRIQSLSDILEDHKIKVGVIENSATEAYFKYSMVPFYEGIWSRIDRDKAYEPSLEDGIERVRKSTKEEPYVFFGESTMAVYDIRQPPCDLYMIRDYPFQGSYAPAFPIGSPLKTNMDLAMLRLKEAGHLRRLESKWFKGECNEDYIDLEDDQPSTVKYPPFQRVDLASFSGALILLIIGLAGGSLVTLMEVLIFRYVSKDQEEAEHDNSLMADKKAASPNSGHHKTNV